MSTKGRTVLKVPSVKKAPAKKAAPQLYKQSETTVIKRSTINFAPYNPKNHTREKINKIKNNFKDVAFLGGIVVNTTTNNLIDGHKRLAALDIIHGYKGPKNDYDVKVELIELSEEVERNQNVFHTSSVTDFDSALLAELIPDLDVEAAGLDDSYLQLLDLEVSEFDADEYLSEPIPKTKNRNLDEAEDNINELRDKKQKHRQQGDAELTLTITFESVEDKQYLAEMFGIDAYDMFIPAQDVIDKLENK